MKISPSTLAILKSFASINSGIYIRAGKELRTMTINGDIFAIAAIEDEFPQNFAIFDLNRFLGVLSLGTDPTVEFESKHMNITTALSKTKYVFAADNLVVHPPETQPKLSAIATFTLPSTVLSELLKAAGILNLPDFSIVAKDGKIAVSVHSKKEASSDSHVTVLGDCDPNLDFVIDIDVEKLRINQDTYSVTVGKTGKGMLVVNFNGVKINYWISAEASSKVVRS